jgi:hypothetical protein
MTIQVSPYKRVNMTWFPVIYEEAKLILPPAWYEIRSPLADGGTCAASYLVSAVRQIWGSLIGNDAHVIIGSGMQI